MFIVLAQLFILNDRHAAFANFRRPRSAACDSECRLAGSACTQSTRSARLDAICRKAMQLRPEDRYASVADMARDIEHYLADEPTTALRESAISHLMRMTRRHRSLAFSAVVSMMILTAISLIAAMRINGARRQADASFMAAERVKCEARFRPGLTHYSNRISLVKVGFGFKGR